MIDGYANAGKESLSRGPRIRGGRHLFAHTHLVRDGSVMLPPTEEHCPRCLHTHLVRGGSVVFQPTMRRYRSKRVRSKATASEPTSREAGMTRHGGACSLQHQEPTSHEVGIETFRAADRENLTRTLGSVLSRVRDLLTGSANKVVTPREARYWRRVFNSILIADRVWILEARSDSGVVLDSSYASCGAARHLVECRGRKQHCW